MLALASEITAKLKEREIALTAANNNGGLIIDTKNE